MRLYSLLLRGLLRLILLRALSSAMPIVYSKSLTAFLAFLFGIDFFVTLNASECLFSFSVKQ